MEEPERDDGVEDRHRRLDDRREAGVDPRLPPGEQPEGERDVDEADDDEPAGVRPDLGERPAAADEDRDDHGEGQRGDPDPAEDQRGRRELPDGDLDEHEGRAPERRDHEQHHEVAPAHALL